MFSTDFLNDFEYKSRFNTRTRNVICFKKIIYVKNLN